LVWWNIGVGHNTKRNQFGEPYNKRLQVADVFQHPTENRSINVHRMEIRKRELIEIADNGS
jgi:hypothetical protein